MTTCNGGHQSMRGFMESVNKIMDQILELSLLYDCQTYFVVEYDHGFLTFNSVEDGSWPPPDHMIESTNRPARRVFSFQELLNRVTEEERKDLIQLLLFITEVAKGPPILESNELQIGDWEQRVYYGNSGVSEIGGLEIVEENEKENEKENGTNNRESTGEDEEKGELGNDIENQRYEALGWGAVSPHWSEFT